MRAAHHAGKCHDHQWQVWPAGTLQRVMRIRPGGSAASRGFGELMPSDIYKAEGRFDAEALDFRAGSICGQPVLLTSHHHWQPVEINLGLVIVRRGSRQNICLSMCEACESRTATLTHAFTLSFQCITPPAEEAIATVPKSAIRGQSRSRNTIQTIGLQGVGSRQYLAV